MRFAVCLSNFGTYADPRRAVRVAEEAAAAGWDGFFVWDHLSFVWGPPSADPWVMLAAVRLPEGFHLGHCPRLLRQLRKKLQAGFRESWKVQRKVSEDHPNVCQIQQRHSDNHRSP